MKTMIIPAVHQGGGIIIGNNATWTTARNDSILSLPGLEVRAKWHPDTSHYNIIRGYLVFNTSVLPANAIIHRVRMRLTASLMALPIASWVGIYKISWFFTGGLTDYYNIATDARDALFQEARDADFDNYMYKSLHDGGTIGVQLYSDDLDVSHINKNGETFYALKVKRDAEDDAPDPSDSSEHVQFYDVEPIIDMKTPALIIDYFVEPQGYEHIAYQLFVNWDGSGDMGLAENEADRMLRYTLERGRDRTIGAAGGGFETPNVGRLTVEVDNSDGRFDPWNKNGALFGLLRPGRMANFGLWHLNRYYQLFTGYVADIRPSGYKNTANLVIEDGAGWLNARSPNIPLLKTDKVSTAIETILDNLEYPWGRDIEEGVDEMEYYWTSGTNGLSEIHKLANSDLGRFAIDAYGIARFYSRFNSDPPVKTITEDKIGTDIRIPMPWDYARSIVNAVTHPRQVGPANSVLWQLLTDTTIAAGDTLTLWCKYRFDGQDVPAEDVYLDSWQPNPDFDVTDIVMTAFSRDAKIEITNNTGNPLILTELVIKGKPIHSPEPIRIQKEATASGEIPAAFTFDFPWVSNVNTAQIFTDVLLAYLSDPKEYPEITVYNRPMLACDIDLEQRLGLSMDTFDINKTFFVNKITHRSGRSMQEIITTLKLTPMLQDQGPDVIILDDIERGKLDTYKLGF